MKEYTQAEYEEFARQAFYKGREVEGAVGNPVYKRQTFNGFLREIDALPQPECGCPKGICIGHTSKFNPERGDIHETIISIIGEKMGVHEDEITLDAHMKDDLGLDSLDIVEFSMEVEREYNFIFDDKSADYLQDCTITQVINHIEKLKS